jgi:hypothetical protein
MLQPGLSPSVSHRKSTSFYYHHTLRIKHSLTTYRFSAINLEVDRIFRHSTMRSPHIEWTSAYIKARVRCFKPSSIESGFRKAGIYSFNPEILLSTFIPPPRTSSPENQVVSQVSNASRILRARG